MVPNTRKRVIGAFVKPDANMLGTWRGGSGRRVPTMSKKATCPA